MSDETEKAPLSSTDEHRSPQLIAVAAVEASVIPSIAADRLYQFAALTAGLFFLATLL
jgi:hypothetical protein